MKPPRKILLLICLLCAASGYWAGLQHGSQRLDETSNVAASQRNQITDEISSERPKGEGSSLRSGLYKPVKDRLGSTRREELLEMYRSDNPITRMEAFVELSKNLDEKSLRAMVKSYEEDGPVDSPVAAITLELLTFAWAQQDPEGALAWADERDPFVEKDIVTRSILDSWARNDPEAALAWARKNYDEKDRSSGRGNELLRGVIRGMSDKDLAGATELMMELNSSPDLDDAASILVPKVWAKGEDAVMNWVESLPPGEARDAAYRSVGKKLAREDLERATQWVDGMEESTVKAEIASDLADILATRNPLEAAAWVSKMAEGEARARSMEKVVLEWAEKDPNAAGEWLNQFPLNGSTDGALAVFSHRIAELDPESALAWADAIQEPERRARAMKYVNSVLKRMSQDEN